MIVILGAFDGFHRGHQLLFERARKMSALSADKWGIVTFIPRPRVFFSPVPVKVLFSDREKVLISQYMGIPELITIPFTQELVMLEPVEFLNHLDKKIGISGIVVGDSYRFGRGRSGTISLLQSECQARGWRLEVVPSMRMEADIISSTVLRRLVTLGNIEQVRKMLGYPFFMEGSVTKGDQRGRQLGFPTANIETDAMKIIPANGVYAGIALVDDVFYPSAISVGFNPTFSSKKELRVEAHLLDFEGCIYNDTILVGFLKRIRASQRYPNASSLINQLKKDIELTKRICRMDFYRVGEFYRKLIRNNQEVHLKRITVKK